MMTGVERAEEQRQMAQVVQRLADEFPYVPEHVITETVDAAHSRFDGARIREYVPLFVERSCRSQFGQHPVVEISA
jgi:hypothetical protein